jgi:xanthine dehydrogenase accessory factor
LTALAPVLRDWIGDGAIVVRLMRTEGSTPRETGATMLISQAAIAGSIGGGQLEFHVIDVARDMLVSGEALRDLDLSLGPQMGQCCGGRVLVRLEQATQSHLETLAARDSLDEQTRPSVMVFGAGHTGRALARALALLPFAVKLVDDRDGMTNDLPGNVIGLRLDDPVRALTDLPAATACVIMTHSQALDYRLAEAALARGDMSYVGLIGSATKRARFVASFRRSGGNDQQLSRLTCPIGGTRIRDKRPEVIAAMVAAELLCSLLPARSTS